MSTRLRLVGNEAAEGERGDGPFAEELPQRGRLPRGRHGIPADLVAAHQRRRLLSAASEALAGHGYGRLTAEHISDAAGVSIRTFYKHFDNLWDCLLAAYDEAADQLCLEIEAACARRDLPADRLAAGIDAALAFLASEPALARLLGAQPPLEAPLLAGARRRLTSRLAALLRDGIGPDDDPRPRDPSPPPGLDERPLDAALTFISGRVAVGGAAGLTSLGPELAALVAGPRRAA